MSGTRVSGVGSIPTRSRQTCRGALGPVGLGALLLCGVIGFVAGSARAQDAPPAPADTLRAPADSLDLIDPDEIEAEAEPDTVAAAGRTATSDTVAAAGRTATSDTLAAAGRTATSETLAPEVSAATPAPRVVQREAVPWTRRPTAIMFRSALFPGWGQWSNGRHLKAAIVFGAEGYLIYRATRAGLRERDARDAARREPALEQFWLAEAERHNAERRDYTWWTVFALILSMGDAYVDAVLGDFEAEFEPEPDDTELRVGYRYQWD